MSIVTLTYDAVPLYLQKGELYRSLSAESSEFEVPVNCYHHDGEAASDLDQFGLLLRVMLFWGLDHVPVGARDFCTDNDITVWEHVALEFLGVESPVYAALNVVFRDPTSCSFTNVVNTNRWELLSCWAQYTARDSELGLSAMREAATLGDVRLLQFLHVFRFVWDEGTCEGCAEHGHLECLKYAHENGCPWGVDTCYVAAAGGHVSCIQYAFDNGLEPDAKVSLCAAMGGQYDTLVYLHENGFPWDNRTLSGAADGNHLNCLIYAREQGLEWTADNCKFAADGGHLSCLQYLHEHGCPWNDETVGRAAKMGHVECLRYALTHSCPIHEHSCSAAAAGNHTACLSILHVHGAHWDEIACREAARYGAMECLVFLYEHSCPWDEHTPEYALVHDNMELMRYALDRGCPCPDYLVEYAAENGDLSCLQYLIEDKLLSMGDDSILFITALLKGNVDCLRYIMDSGCTYDDCYFGGEETWKTYDKSFNKEPGMFVSCLELAIQRGWPWHVNLVNYIHSRDIADCIEFIDREYDASTDVVSP